MESNIINNYVNKWYTEDEDKKKVSHFIEKMARYYELKYPNTMLMNDCNINDLINNDTLKDFYDLLNFEEQLLIKEVKYPSKLYFNKNSKASIFLDKDGLVLSGFDLECVSKDIDNYEISGLNIEELIQYLSNLGIDEAKYCNIKNEIQKHEYNKCCQMELYNTVMNYIMEKDNSKIGYIRASIFKGKYNLNIKEEEIKRTRKINIIR